MSDAVSAIRDALHRAEKDARKGVDTHSPECHLWHPECARVRVNALVKALEELERSAPYYNNDDGSVRVYACPACEREWTPGAAPQHDGDCPFAVLDGYLLRGVWRGEEGA